MRIARQIQMRRPLLDAGQQQVLDGVEADHAPLHRVTHRFRHLAFRKVLQQAQHLDVLALAARAEARFEETAQRIEGRIELPTAQRRRLVNRCVLHRGHDYPSDQPRHMVRTTIAGDSDSNEWLLSA